MLHVRAPTGRAILTMRLTAEGPVLELEGVSLSIATQGDLKLSADRLAITTRGDAEVACGGNLTLRAEGNLHAEGQDHTIVATRGDVSLRANDDVRIDGERIALNSPIRRPVRTCSPPQARSRRRLSGMDFVNRTGSPAALLPEARGAALPSTPP